MHIYEPETLLMSCRPPSRSRRRQPRSARRRRPMRPRPARTQPRARRRPPQRSVAAAAATVTAARGGNLNNTDDNDAAGRGSFPKLLPLARRARDSGLSRTGTSETNASPGPLGRSPLPAGVLLLAFNLSSFKFILIFPATTESESRCLRVSGHVVVARATTLSDGPSTGSVIFV